MPEVLGSESLVTSISSASLDDVFLRLIQYFKVVPQPANDPTKTNMVTSARTRKTSSRDRKLKPNIDKAKKLIMFLGTRN